MQTITLKSSRKSAPLIKEIPNLEFTTEKYEIPQFPAYILGIYFQFKFYRV